MFTPYAQIIPSMASLVALPAVLVSDRGTADISGNIGVGNAMYAKAGLGTHHVILDITTPESEVPEAITSIDALVLSPSEITSEYRASMPMLPAKGALYPQLYLQDVTTALGVSPHKFIAFKHEFAERGEYRLSLRFNFGLLGEWVSTAEAVRVDIGDGLFNRIV